MTICIDKGLEHFYLEPSNSSIEAQTTEVTALISDKNRLVRRNKHKINLAKYSALNNIEKET